MSARGRDRILLALIGAAGFVLGPSPSAPAAEDGGTRSIFAEGAGNRGLALGGAYVALASDASALIWNPGGLGLAARNEFQASHVDYGLGFHEEYASLVLPSWRWGALGIAYRSFGVDGIEARDDRNVLLGKGLSSSESELSLGYGRRLGPAVALGGAVKLQRQVLAGFSGSGVGADAGITIQPLVAFGSSARWADRVSAALAARNWIEPAIRLDQESVRDPGTFRSGLAYQGSRVVATLDLEQAPGVAPQLHAGAEFSPHSVISLRGGFSRGSATAGAGVRWQSLSVDYAYEDHAVGPVHRIGVSIALGSTLAERREASIRADEQRLQARLSETLDRLEKERVQSLLARAEEARAQKRYDAAFEILAGVATLSPDQPEAKQLELRCLRESASQLERRRDYPTASLAYARILADLPADPSALEGQRRCRAGSDLRAARTAAMQKQFGLAMDAFAAEDWEVARKGFAAALQASPADEDAAAMLRRTDLAIAKRIGLWIQEARRSIDSGHLGEAGSLLDRVRALDPSADGLVQATLVLTHARELARRQAVSADSADGSARPVTDDATVALRGAQLTPSQHREIEDLYRRGLEALKQNRSLEGLRYWELVWTMDPTFQKVGEFLKREYLMRGLDSFTSGRLEDAISRWEKALQVDPTDARARGYLARAEKQLARTRELLGERR
ncbi:MAG TPA: PorV/PorQ family protein [Candidatus Eisenbacteria bacterium]|jgi:tetratricopeptide (TPR) repeat protein